MRQKHTDTNSAKRAATDWGRLRSLKDEDIRAALTADPEVHPTNRDYWKQARRVLPQPKPAPATEPES